MIFKRVHWFGVAAVLSVINVIAAGVAAGVAEPWHATIHATLAVAFGLWAQRLRQRPGGSELEAQVEVLSLEVDRLRHELSDALERLDFVERLLAQGAPESRRVGPDRPAP